MKTLIGFFFETGDASCQYYEVWILAESKEHIGYGKIHNIIYNEPYCDLGLDEDEECEDVVRRIMDESEYEWTYFTGCKNPVNGINNILTFFL